MGYISVMLIGRYPWLPNGPGVCGLLLSVYPAGGAFTSLKALPAT